MTVREAVEKTDALYPNVFSFSQKAFLLEQLDSKVYYEILKKYADCSVVFRGEYLSDADIELLIDSPFEDIYIKYLVMQFDIINSDITRYQNSAALYNAEYLDFVKHYNRNHQIKPVYININ